MKSIQTILSNFYSKLIEIENLDVYHFERPEEQGPPYAVWQEEGEKNAFSANNRKEEQTIEGTLDFFTQTEFDPLVDDIQDALNSIENCSWNLDTVQYEDNTKLIHYTWSWELD